MNQASHGDYSDTTTARPLRTGSRQCRYYFMPIPRLFMVRQSALKVAEEFTANGLTSTTFNGLRIFSVFAIHRGLCAP